MSDPSHRFFLEALDPDYGCPVLEAMFEVTELADFHAVLGPCAADDSELRGSYSLEAGDLANCTKCFGVAFDPVGRDVLLSRWNALWAAPYLVHTNYELFRLVIGTKQFAAELELFPPHVHFREDFFDRYASDGLLHKETFGKPFPTPIKSKDGHIFEGEREVCHAHKGQEWRIPAWRLVREAFRKSSWNNDFERIQGMLFGYEEWQVDWWIAHIRKRRASVAPEAASSRGDGGKIRNL